MCAVQEAESKVIDYDIDDDEDDQKQLPTSCLFVALLNSRTGAADSLPLSCLLIMLTNRQVFIHAY